MQTFIDTQVNHDKKARESGEYMYERVDNGSNNDRSECNIYLANEGIALKNDDILKDKDIKSLFRKKYIILVKKVNGKLKLLMLIMSMIKKQKHTVLNQYIQKLIGLILERVVI